MARQSDWIEMAKRGDRDAFHRVLEENYAMIHRVAYRFTGTMQDADDIAQDVCLKLAEKIRSFRGDSLFSTWLYRLVVNACADHRKRRQTNTRNDRSYAELEQQQQASSADDNRMIAWLYREIAQLEEPLKATALLVLAENLSHTEAGKVLNCAESTVSWRMHELRKILKARKEASHA